MCTELLGTQLLPINYDMLKITIIWVIVYFCDVLTENGQLFACGEMDNGKLGCDPDADIDHFSPQLVNVSDRVICVSCGHNHTVAVTGH